MATNKANLKFLSIHKRRHVVNKSFSNNKDLNRHMAIMRREMKKGKSFFQSHAIANRIGTKAQRKLSTVNYIT